MKASDRERLVLEASKDSSTHIDEKLYGSLSGQDDEGRHGKIKLGDDEERGNFGKSHKTKKTNRKRIFLLIILSMVVVSVTAFLIYFFIMKGTMSAVPPIHDIHYNEDVNTLYCDSPHCQQVASSMFTKMDPSIDPCEDFYEYSCGGWVRSHQIPDKLPTIDTFYELRDELASQLKVLINQPINPEEDLRVTREIKQHYLACTDKESIERKDEFPLTNLLEFLGGWPLLGSRSGGNWDESNFDLTNLLSTINKVMDEGSLTAIVVSRDDKNPSRNILWVDQGKLGLPNRDFYLDERVSKKYLQAYYAFMKEVVSNLEGNSDDVDQQLQDIIDFERRIAANTKSETERRKSGGMYHKMTIAELQQLSPQINWLKYLNNLVEPWTTLDTSEEVVLTAPKNIAESFKIVEETNPRTVVNFVLWRVVVKVINHLSLRFRKASAKFGLIFVKPEEEDYDSVGIGSDVTLTSWKTCVKLINEEMTFATGRLYVDTYYDDRNQKPVSTMVSDIESTFLNMVNNSRWMDKNTQEAAMDKAEAIRSNIGFPQWTMDDVILEEYYRELDFSPEDHFDNYLNYLNWNFKRSFRRLREKPSNEWIHGPAAVNAYYSFINTLTVPAGILQPPFYHSQSPQYLNFGGIGMVIGHELTHGFDDKGRVYDKDGVLKESWWSKESESEFRRKEECIIDQYSNYRMNECNMTINGHITVGENIADNGGIKEAYTAYRIWREKTRITEPLLRLQELNLNQDQLLFVNFAQIWCSKFTVDGARNKILTGRHSPGYYRVIGPLSNLPTFSDVFNCSAGTRMNPTSKCQVW